jgi:uncharacterized membrane protein YphA (DoxX/SURF4 family)
MKILAKIAQFLVGAIFIFSGFVKLNDPVGTQLKLEEYFEVFAADFAWMAGFWTALVPFALVFSVLFCSLEIILGVALLVKFRLKTTALALFALCAFFGFLTFYSAYFNKVTDCGCFGDFVKLKPWHSFWKDMVLLVLLALILWKAKALSPDLKTGKIVAAVSILCLALGLYAIRYNPPLDFLPYAVGQNIPQNMKAPAAPKYKYLMEKAGQVVELDNYPTDTTYKFKEMILLNPDEVKPKITDYALWNDEFPDYKEESFKGQKLMVVINKVAKAQTGTLAEVAALAKALQGSQVTVFLVTSDSEEKINALRHEYQLGIPFFFADEKVLKTIVRTNPGLWLLSDGTVKGKWSYAHVPSRAEVLALLN